MSDLTGFLLQRIAEDEARAMWTAAELNANRIGPSMAFMPPDELPRGAWGRMRVLAECEAKRRIVEQHKAWPVLVETPPTFEQVGSGDLNSVTFRASQQMMWLTEQEYRTRFGSEPPTAPMIRTLAAVYADHPDYREEWKP